MSTTNDHDHEREHTTGRSGPRPGQATEPSQLDGVLDLQARAGNRAVAATLGGGAVQRAVAPPAPIEEEQLEDEKVVNRSADGVDSVAGPVHADVAGRIDAARSSGGSLPDGVRNQMEAGFGTSFADVRVHTGAESDELNQSLQARAFTTGNDVFLRGDAPGAGTADGQRLIAHELAHVVQQRTEPGGGAMRVGRSDDPAEAAADRAADEVLRRGTALAHDDEHG